MASCVLSPAASSAFPRVLAEDSAEERHMLAKRRNRGAMPGSVIGEVLMVDREPRNNEYCCCLLTVWRPRIFAKKTSMYEIR